MDYYNAIQIMARNYPVLVDGRSAFYIGDDGNRLELTTDPSRASEWGTLDRANAVAVALGERLTAAVFPFSERPTRPDTQSDRETWRLLVAIADFLRVNNGDGRHIDAFLDGLKPAEWTVAKATVAERAKEQTK
jgi:hypothetical protein